MRRILAALLATTIVGAPLDAMAEWTRGQGDQQGQQGQYPQGQYPQGQYPQGQYPQGQYPNGGDNRRDDRNGDWNRGGRRGCDNGAYGQMQSQLQRMYERVRQGQYDGSYSRDSARKFFRAISLDRQYLDSYRNNDGCLDQREASDVKWRIDALRQQMIQYDRRPGNRRGDWDRY